MDLSKLSLKSEEKIKPFTGKQKLRNILCINLPKRNIARSSMARKKMLCQKFIYI
jgi:hypothetical protein